jgi:hypothetical protein
LVSPVPFDDCEQAQSAEAATAKMKVRFMEGYRSVLDSLDGDCRCTRRQDNRRFFVPGSVWVRLFFGWRARLFQAQSG